MLTSGGRPAIEERERQGFVVKTGREWMIDMVRTEHTICARQKDIVKNTTVVQPPRLYVALRLVLRYACRENESIKDVG